MKIKKESLAFSRLTVLIADYGKKGVYRTSLCLCVCGKEVVVYRHNLIGGNTKSCGCLKKQTDSQNFTTHGLSGTRLHNIWVNMIQRCTNHNHRDYHLYGGRCVDICDEWRDFLPFYKWAMANKYNDKLVLDKDIKGTGLLYSPDNCIWTTPKNNTRHTRQVKLNERKAAEIRNSNERVKDLATKYGVHVNSIYRIKTNRLWK